METIKAFLMGMLEFRSCVTPNYGDDYDLLLAYDRGRDLAHRVTLRRFEDA